MADTKNHRSNIQSFLRWLQGTHIESVSPSPSLPEVGSAQVQRSREGLSDFVPDGLVRAHLDEANRLRLILDDLEVENTPRVRQQILDHHPKTFGILVFIGRGQWISHFVTYQLRDNNLPLYARPRYFPVDPTHDTTDFFSDFQQAQWRFCAFTFDGLTNFPVDDDRIMPFTEKSWINEGASSDIFKVRIDPRHDKMKGKVDMSTTPVKGRHFALKVYKGDDARRWHDYEAKAFERFGSTGLQWTNMIGFYCSFSHHERYQALFEYADMDTLERFMKEEDPPGTNDEVRDFWASFVRIAAALTRIHELDPEDDQPDQSIRSLGQMVHQDIKPSNILLASRPGSSAYNCHIGLADLGSSRYRAAHTSAEMRDSRANKTYGAPECHREDRVDDRRNMRTTTKADVWSLAAVMSEVCVWVIYGSKSKHGLEAYRTKRKKALSGRCQGSECFHDGTGKVLSAVEEEHAKLLGQDRCDSITKRILELMPQMLQPEPELRLNAAKLRLKLDHILDDDAKTREASGVTCSPQTTPAHHHKPDRATTLPSSAVRPSQLGPRINRRHASSDEHSESSFSNYLRQDSGNSRAHSMPGLTESVERMGIKQSPMSLETVDESDQPHRTRKELPRTPEIVPLTQLANSAHDVPSDTRTSYATPVSLQQSPIAAATLLSYSPEVYTSPLGVLDPVHREAVSAPPASPTNHSVPRQPPQHSPEAPKPEAPVKLSFAEAELWCNAHGSRSGQRLRGDEMFEQLKGRDHVFVVDGSESMRAHKDSNEDGSPSVKSLLHVLAYMVKDKDPNGIDLRFLGRSAGGTNNSKRSTELVQAVLGHSFRGKTDPASALEPLLKEYCDALEKYRLDRQGYQERRGTGRHFRKLLHARPPEPPRPLSIYVLTDGIWESGSSAGGNYLDGPIRNVVDELHNARLPRRQFGIQFIRFGTHPHGLRRLVALDNLKQDLDLKMDIVDMEPANGNIWKMLLGAINERFDLVDEFE